MNDKHHSSENADGNAAPGTDVGFCVPAQVGMSIDQIATPALIIDLDAFEANVRQLKSFLDKKAIQHRAHAKTHKSADIARYQIEHGGACGVCCQKVSEAQALVDAGIDDVLVSNQVTGLDKIDRLARLAARASVAVCVDDADNVEALSAAASRHDTTIDCLVEIDCGAGRCGVAPGADAVALARQIDVAAGLNFAGLQAYQGSAQHVHDYHSRKARIDIAVEGVRDTMQGLSAAGIACDTVTGAGTGSYYFETASGVYNELQCGSYIFMDVDYQRVNDDSGAAISEFRNSLFVLTSIMSKTRPEQAICDAGLKAHSIDSGLPRVFGRDDLEYIKCSDEHGVLTDPANTLRLNDRLKLVPGHCDPTCNLYDWYVGVRNDKVECLWPVTARGMVY